MTETTTGTTGTTTGTTPAEPRLELLDAQAAAAALSRAGAAARGFLDLDPVTQNDALLARLLERSDAQVFRCGEALLGCVPNPAQPRQATVATTSPDPAPLRALLRFLTVYQRRTSFTAATTAAAPAREALVACGFEQVGTLAGHRFQSGRHLDVEIHHASEGATRCE